MARKKTHISLYSWAQQSGRVDLIRELLLRNDDPKRVENFAREIGYDSPANITWKCPNGHEYKCVVAARTIFDLRCPTCHPEKSLLPVGTKHGCLTIVGNFNDYQREADLDPERRKIYTNRDFTDFFGRTVDDFASKEYYKCQCKCGKIQYLPLTCFFESRHRYCPNPFPVSIRIKDFFCDSPDNQRFIINNICGLQATHIQKKQASFKRVFAENYDTDYTGTRFESLDIISCVDDKSERISSWSGSTATYTIYKKYKCRCRLCGKELLIDCTKFKISPPTYYGATAYYGYWSDAHCDCHRVSSFQWIVNKLLYENRVPYDVEYAFDDLCGISGNKLLRFDFVVFNADGSIKCLIECQGEQHYAPVDEFGGKTVYNTQIQNDMRKREYASMRGIPLLEISYEDKKYEKVALILQQNHIIQSNEQNMGEQT